jgi:putative endonuclease
MLCRMPERPSDTPGPAARGAEGEAIAAGYLRRQGWKLLQRNWRHGKGEIDLICMDGPVMVFVEVRRRRARAAVPPFFSISRRKWQVLRATCFAFLGSLRKRPLAARCDVIGILDHPDGSHELLHHRKDRLL